MHFLFLPLAISRSYVSLLCFSVNQNRGGESLIKTCFVVSPIGEPGSETRSSADKLFKYIISPVCKNCGFEAVRVDQM